MTDVENKNIHQNDEDNDNRSKNNKNINKKKTLMTKLNQIKFFLSFHMVTIIRNCLWCRGLFTEHRSLRKIKKSSY